MYKYIVEFVGTFIFLAVILSHSDKPLAIGVALAAVIYFGGPISGGHFNPAVSFMKFAEGSIENVDALGYITSQVLGGVAALYFLKSASNTTV